jgi:diguanylate cyclase (GGDEF)-like protein
MEEIMINLTGFRVDDILHESEHIVVHQATHIKDNTSVVLKCAKRINLTPVKRIFFLKDYQLSKDIQAGCVIEPINFVESSESLIAVYPDTGCISLNQAVRKRLFQTDEILRLFYLAADALAKIHSKKWVHMNLTLDHILFDLKKLKVFLIDWKYAIQMKGHFITAPPFINRNSDIIPPELTGFTNDFVDERIDLYALGCIFYELFTNAPVFHEKNPLRQIQSHIMCQPVAPHEGYDPYMPVAQHVPESVSQILMQLLEKNPSKRYDNAHHLKCDLYKCLTDKSFISHIDPPGQLFPVIHATNKLYERDEAIDRIHVIYNSFSQQPFDDGLSTLLLISGKPGTGKTALCKTLIPHVFEKNGYWIYESCTNTPDFPLGLIGRILSQLLKMMHSRFSSELDNQIKQLTYKGLLCPEFLPELIPELTPLSNHLFPSTKSHSQIIDAKPFLLALFQMLGQKFQPMILCIEHVEWADDESIMILESLLSDTRQSFFVVATCHLNPSSSFQNLITHSQKRGVNVYSVDTCNLSELAVNQFMLDIFHFAAKDSEHFSKRIFDITEGNPRAVHMALDSMVSQKQIMIKKSDLIINDVSDSKSFLGHSSLYYLDHSEREILQKISCIGQSWSMSFACKITGLAELEMEAIILKAFKLGLIFPDRSFEKYDLRNNDNIWMFSDSGIHQRLYGDLSNDTKKEIHKTISQSMSMSTQAIHASLYMVARHLKRTNDLKVDHARIYLSAGERALMSGLFLTAYQFFDAGRSIFSEKDWQKHHQLLFDIHLNAMIAANFASLDDEISMIVEELSQNIFSDLEKLKYYECLAHIYFRQNQHEKVSETVRKGLSVVGQKLTIPTIQRQWTIVTTGLKYKQLQKKQKISDKDSKHRLIIRMMLLFIRSAYHWDPKNATGLIAKAIHRMLKNGITTDAPYLWILFARFLIDRTGFSKIALQWAHMGQSSLNQLNETDLQTETRLNYIWYVSHRSKSFHNHLAQIKEEIDRCLIRGYPDHAVQAAEYYLFLSLSCGKRLKNILSEIHDIRVHARMRLDNNDAHAMYLQTIHNLISGITPPHILTGQSFNEQKAIESWTSNNDTHRLLVLYTIKLMLCVLFKNHEKAVVLAHTCENLLDIALGTPMAQVINLYVVLAYSGAYHSAGHEEQKKWRKQINFHVRQLKKWSVQCPENAMHRYYLALAEETKNVDISNRDIPEYYDKAIALAKTNQFCHEEAFSNELAGTYYTKKERDKLAKTYIVDAYHAYSKWGADRKVAEYARQEKILDPNEIDQTSVWPTTIKNTQSKQVSSLSQVDNEDIWKVAQAFCVELKFDVLLENIIQTALRHSGAHKGCLVLKKRQAFFVEAHMNMETQEMGLMVSEPLETSHKICLPIAQQVIQSNTPVCLWDAGKQGEYQYDVYIRENAPRSLLCVPVAYHDNIAGLLYLENKRLTGLFTTDRVNRIQIIASQAAIAIKNAQFFHTQEKTVQNRATDLNLTVHQLSSAIQDLEARSREMMLLNQFSDALHGCQTDEASYLVLQSFAQKLFPGDIGILWIGDKNEMKTVTTWGAVTAVSDKLEKTACPCLQSKSLLFVEDVVSTPRCKSCGPANDHVYICIPLKDQSGEMGVLHFQFGTVPPQIFDDTFTRRLESRRMLICRMIAHYALALTNLRLREALKYESRHDPLTGLFNRRHMQNMLKEAYEKAKQYNQYLGIVMIDIDHFKSFNDTYGHDTGDSVLKHLGAYLQEKSCSTLHPCRYGGEEFLLMCPDLRPDELFQTAESVRKGIMNEIKVPYEDKLLDVTASLGTAVFPEHGDDMTQVIQNADQALYKSKESGRNQVQMSGF